MISPRLLLRFVLLAAPCWLAAPGARAQDAGAGVVHLAGWSPSARAGLAPRVDTFSLGYRYFVRDGAPRLSLAIGWKPGRGGVYRGRWVEPEELPADLRLTRVSLRAEVYADGRAAGSFALALDSLALAPVPDVYAFEPEGLSWSTLFEGATAEQARAHFAQGFELRGLRVEEAVFEEGARTLARRGGRYATAPPPAPPGVVYVPDLIDLLVWLDGGPDHGGRPRGGEPRQDAVGRDAREDGRGRTRNAEADSGRSGARGLAGLLARGGEEEDEDEEEDDLLVPAALVGVAAIGVVAFAGGTVGFFGNLEQAPFGLASGFVRPRGGALLQVGVNEALLGAGDGPPQLLAKLTVFYDFFGSPVRPAVGGGVVMRSEHDVRPSVSLGAAGSFGPLLLIGGYDVAAGGVELGLAFNFRHRR